MNVFPFTQNTIGQTPNFVPFGGFPFGFQGGNWANGWNTTPFGGIPGCNVPNTFGTNPITGPISGYGQFGNIPFNQFGNVPFGQFGNIPFSQFGNIPFSGIPFGGYNWPVGNWTNTPWNVPFGFNPYFGAVGGQQTTGEGVQSTYGFPFGCVNPTTQNQAA